MRAFKVAPPHLIDLPVLRGEEIEQQAIEQPAVDAMAPPLPADEAEAEAFYGLKRRVMLHGPGIDHVQSEILKRKGQES